MYQYDTLSETEPAKKTVKTGDIWMFVLTEFIKRTAGQLLYQAID